jgi:hypothetical protein
LQLLDRFLVLTPAGRGHFSLKRRKKVAWWQLDDDEGDNGDKNENRNHT